MSTFKLGLRLTNFSPSAQAIIKKSREVANIHRISKIDTDDLLAAVADSDTPSGKALRKHRVTYGEVLSCCTYHHGEGILNHQFSEEDFESNFSKDTGLALQEAKESAEVRNEPVATESDLLYTLLGFGHEKFASYRIIKRLELTPGVIFKDLESRKQPDKTKPKEKPRRELLSTT